MGKPVLSIPVRSNHSFSREFSTTDQLDYMVGKKLMLGGLYPCHPGIRGSSRFGCGYAVLRNCRRRLLVPRLYLKLPLLRMCQLVHADCFDWLRERAPGSLHAVCTDPPYGLLEFTEKEIAKLRAGRGGVWRLPPTIGGSRRDPLPRFTVLTDAQKSQLQAFFREWGALLMPALVPGAHVCVAGHPMLQPLVQVAMAGAGFEIRPALMRLYFSFRGGDRPKNAEQEFPGVCVTPKGACEPWMLFRKPISERTVAENLRRWKTGGLRRLSLDRPLPDAIPSGRTPDRETAISDHPCLKPQHFMRILVRALLPLGEGV